MIWILFLLAAMFLGPSVILKKMEMPHGTLNASKESSHPDRSELRALIKQEQLIDAPASLPEIPVE